MEQRDEGREVYNCGCWVATACELRALTDWQSSLAHARIWLLQGGAINMEGSSTMTLDNCIFTDNDAVRRGPLISRCVYAIGGRAARVRMRHGRRR